MAIKTVAVCDKCGAQCAVIVTGESTNNMFPILKPMAGWASIMVRVSDVPKERSRFTEIGLCPTCYAAAVEAKFLPELKA